MKHLTLDERIKIQNCMNQRMSFKATAKKLKKAATTIQREIINHRTNSGYRGPNILPPCKFKAECTEVHLCKDMRCRNFCRDCLDCHEHCKLYYPAECKELENPPYVCNGCPKVKFCTYNRFFYMAVNAQHLYENTLIESREGINQTPEKVEQINALIKPLVDNGQSLAHIYASHADEIGCSRSSLYRYIDMGVFAVRNIDLPRKVRYRIRKKNAVKTDAQVRELIKDRTYAKFQEYLSLNPETDVVEGDTVVGPMGSKKALLTLLFRSCSLMLAFLLPDKTERAVLEVFDHLYRELGHDAFCSIFPVVLFDRGSEFLDPKSIEQAPDGTQRTKVFYCDPQCAWQKGRLERNHEFIRYVVPKTTGSFDNYTQDDITLLVNHINSVSRDIYHGKTPYDVSLIFLDNKLHEVCELLKIAPDEVLLKPNLLPKRNS